MRSRLLVCWIGWGWLSLGPVAAERAWGAADAAGAVSSPAETAPSEPNPADDLAALASAAAPLLANYCGDCHTGEGAEADVDVSAFPTSPTDLAPSKMWQQAAHVLASRQMPPPDAAQPSDEELATLERAIGAYLRSAAAAHAGDPGLVPLRRLNNAQLAYTLRDLTGVAQLDPARQFPPDGAAGEGFTNAGAALSMSPTLADRYLEAAQEVAQHAVLLPGGLGFAAGTSRRDATNEALQRIRDFYARHCVAAGALTTQQQGIDLDVNRGGSLPLAAYFAALLDARETLARGETSLADLAAKRGISVKYLTLLHSALTGESHGASGPLAALCAQFQQAGPADAEALARTVEPWQAALWKYNSVGHIGLPSGPRSWLEPLQPLAAEQAVRLALPTTQSEHVSAWLVADDAGDGAADDLVVWERPRLVAPGKPDLLLRDVRALVTALEARQAQWLPAAARCLAAADEALQSSAEGDAQQELARLAAAHDVDPVALRAWFAYLGIASAAPAQGPLIDRPLVGVGGVAEINGWTGDDALSVVANPTDQTAHIPGLLPPRRVAVHPAPTRAVCVGWRAPGAAVVRLAGSVQHAHPACGNGVAWSIELRRGGARQRLAAGTAQGDAAVAWGPLEEVALRAGDFVVVKIDPRDGNHACDLTLVDLTIDDGTRQWNLARELSPDLAAANPHPDAAGQPQIWWLTSESAAGVGASQIPPGSLLAAWQTAATSDQRRQLAERLQRLIDEGAADLPADHPDAQLRAELVALGGPLLTSGLEELDLATLPADASSSWGLDPALFGRGPQGEAVDRASLAVQAPSILEIRLPASLAAGYELVTSGRLAPGADQGSVQLHASAELPPASGLRPGVPVITAAESPAQQRWATSFAAFQTLFPPSVCYTRIVPVDEVVTLTLFYREDDRLRELALDEGQTRELDRLWDELLYVAEEPLQLVDAFEQLMEFATQDRADLVTQFATMREPILARAAAYRARRISDEPAQLAAALALADRAYRRPLSDAEAAQLREFYQELRGKELGHAEALRLVLVRIFVSPKFLYRTESPPEEVAAGPVSAHELATRLSYFLWSSSPDAELRAAADEGRLTNEDELLRQVARLRRDPKIRRLAEEFACQWLHVYQFDRLDEKSARHFPEFAALRGAMYEETIRFFADLFQRDGSVLDVLDADYAFVNDELAAYYGLPQSADSEWRRVDGVRQFGRGGVLAQAAVLARQAGASRTSPILRGNFVCEALLGEPPPKPPKNVPPLAETPQEGLTERQLTELHVSDPACAKCHARIDPFGFALEGYDAIGRARQVDAHGLPVDTRATLPDGTAVQGLDGLRTYLLQERRDAFVRQFNRKLLGFALGRATQLSDEPLLDAMHHALVAQDFRVGAALEQIVLSRQFREIRGATASDAELAKAASSPLSAEQSAQE